MKQIVLSGECGNFINVVQFCDKHSPQTTWENKFHVKEFVMYANNALNFEEIFKMRF